MIPGSSSSRRRAVLAIVPAACLLVAGMSRAGEKTAGAPEAPRRLPGAFDSVGPCAFGPEAATLAALVDQGEIALWDLRAGGGPRLLEGHTESVFSIAFSPDGRRLASGSADRTVRVWDVASGRLLRTLAPEPPKPIYSVRFSPDGSLLAAGGIGPVTVWDSGTWEVRRSFGGFTRSVAFGPDGRTIAAATSRRTESNSLSLWDAASGRTVRTFSDRLSPIDEVLIGGDGRRVVARVYSGAVRIWEIDSGAEQPAPPGYFAGFWLEPDGRTLVVWSREGILRFWDLTAGREERTTDVGPGVRCLGLSPRGETLVALFRSPALMLLAP